MNYLKNHCWCSKDNWTGGLFNCNIIVSITSYEEHDKDDWANIIDRQEYFSQEKYDNNREVYKDVMMHDDTIRALSTSKINTLKPHVYDWLMNNVPDDASGKKMWCIGNKEYIATDACSSFSFFFQRRKDAMAFIKEFSKWKKPVHYCQYFTDVRRKLDLNTLKYVPT